MGLFSFKKTRDPFYALLEAQALKAKEACEALVLYCKEPTWENGNSIKAVERDADDIRRTLSDRLYNTFITPIDREDLYRISGNIDDITDYAWYTVKDSHIYNIEPDEACLRMAETLLRIAEGVHECIRNIEVDYKAATDAAVHVKKMENELNQQYHKAVNDLFEEDDFKKVMKYREVYNHLNHASDKADHAADLILTVLVKK